MTRPSLTRADQVLKVVRHGGRIEPTGERGLLRLVDRRGAEVPAWQQALKYIAKHAEFVAHPEPEQTRERSRMTE